MLRPTLLALLLVPIVANAQDKKTPDHGRILSCALDVFPHKLKDTTNLADTKNYVFRGKVISLGKDKRFSICYDVEHMRVAGAWIGPPMTFSADKNMGPTVEGLMQFATKPGPGWADPRAAHDSKRNPWDDPREGKEGPLPRDWAHYNGLYVHGDKVVLSYTVGDMDVLEMPELIETDGFSIVARNFWVGPNAKAHLMYLADYESLRQDSSKTWLLPFHYGLFTKLRRNNENRVFRIEVSENPKARTFRVFLLPVGKDAKSAQVEKVLERIDHNAIDPSSFTKGGPVRWTQSLETTITRGDVKSGPYTLDQIQLPEKNPWNASIRFSGLDFFPDGRAALCTWDGDVWIVEGLEHAGQRPTAKLKWKRFASGLQQPLGLKIINGYIYTAGRDQITKLHDLNNDGEADYYENFNNDAGLTLQRHEFVMDLETDKDGNLYYCRSGHYLQSKRGDNCCVYKLSPDGKKLEKFARGFREPNGLSIAPDGTMTVADNEGNGIPQTPIYRLLQGKNYGFTPSLTGKVNEGTFKLQQQPMVWLGPKIDGSAGSQVWVPGKPRDGRPWALTWGPLAGQLLHTSYGNCALFSVLIDKTAEPWQAAVWKFPLTFNSGIMRARFNPKDGQLYVCGLRGWGTSGVKDGQFARVRYTGKDLPIPVGYRVVKTGIEITFSHALDKAAAEDDDNWAGTWSGVLKKVPSAKELQEMPITSVRLSADRKTATVAIEKVRPVPNFALLYRIKAADGAAVSGELNGTIHRVP